MYTNFCYLDHQKHINAAISQRFGKKSAHKIQNRTMHMVLRFLSDLALDGDTSWPDNNGLGSAPLPAQSIILNPPTSLNIPLSSSVLPLLYPVIPSLASIIRPLLRFHLLPSACPHFCLTRSNIQIPSLLHGVETVWAGLSSQPFSVLRTRPST